MKTHEFLMWNNCTNKCKFCHQCLRNDPETHLDKHEMLKCIIDVQTDLDNIVDQEDILLVGGEILAPYDKIVTDGLRGLFYKVCDKIKENKIRYCYINTNLLYKDRTILDQCLKAFTLNNIEDHLKFTTSYDLYGRFEIPESERLFLVNLEWIQKTYPTVNVVVNVILTKQAIAKLVSREFDPQKFQKKYGIKYINFLPYIPIPDDSSMTPSFRDIIRALLKLEQLYPGYIQNYIDDYDLNQNKQLFEYRKSTGFVECTAQYAECHHNSNFKKVLSDGSCYICKLIEIFR